MKAEDEAAWSLRLLGHFSLRHRDGEVALTARKAIALLVYLALQPDRTARRDTLATLLWEDVDVAQARVSLRQAIASVRRAERDDAPILATSPDLVTLDPRVATDVDAFRRLAAGSAAERAAATDLYRGDLATGFSVRDADAFNEWLAIAQAQWRQAAIDLLQRIADEALAPGADANAGIAAGLKLLAIDAFNEGGHRALMRLYARQGRAARALAQYRGLADLLRQELQVAPDADTQALHEELRAGRRRREEPAAAVPSDRSPVPGSDEHFADLAEDEANPAAAAPPPERGIPIVRTRAWKLYAGSILGIALVVGGYVAVRLAGPLAHPVPQIARIFPIVATEENEGAPSLSPDGRTLVFAMTRNGNVDLYATPVDRQEAPARLTSDPSIDRSPRWRPDGGAIAFVRTVPRRDRPCTIYVRLMPAGTERPVGRCRNVDDTRLAWGADGRTLYFSDNLSPQGATQILALDLGNGAVREVTSRTETVADIWPAVAGSRLALFRQAFPTSGDLVVHDLVSGAETIVRRDVPGGRGLSWGVDFDGLFYTVAEGDQAGLWWSGATADAPLTRLSAGLAAFGAVSAARGGRRLAVQTSQRRLSVRRIPAGLADASGIAPLAALGTGVLDAPPVEGPDGRLAFVSSRSGGPQVWLSDGAGPPQPLTDGSDLLYEQLAWAPNGRFLAASARYRGRSDVLLIDAATGRLVRVSGGVPGVNSLPSFSADGQYLYWSSYRADRVVTMRVEPGRPSRPVVVDEDGIATMRPSRDGRFFYYWRHGRQGIFRRAVDAGGMFTGPEELVTAAVGPSQWNNWALAGGSLVFGEQTDVDGEGGLVRFDLATRRTSPIAGTAGRQARLSVSATPRGALLLTSVTTQDDILGMDLD